LRFNFIAITDTIELIISQSKIINMRVSTMVKHFILVLWIILTPLFFTAAIAQTSAKGTRSVDGILSIDDHFQIFPENQPGNTIYLNKKRLVSRDDLTLVDIVEGPDGYIYHGLDETGHSVLGYTGNRDAKFIQLKGGFYQLITDSNNKKKIYWINGNRKIEDLLPKRNTGTGLVFNDVDKAAFYHIAKGETIETDEGKERYQYTFRLHVVDTKTRQLRHLPIIVKDFSLKLRLEWMDENTLKYTLSNGQIETVAIR